MTIVKCQCGHKGVLKWKSGEREETALKKRNCPRCHRKGTSRIIKNA